MAFTLVELLGVLAVMSAIALIVVPVGTGIMEKSRKNAFVGSVKNAMGAVLEDYAADDFKKFPVNGIVADDITNIKNNEFISGKFDKVNGEIIAKKVTNGRYCGTGTRSELEVVLGECYLLDHTPPTNIQLVAGAVTSNSIQVIASAIDEESDIVSYEFSYDGGKTFSKPTINNVFSVGSLKNGTAFKFQVRVTNQNHLSATSEIVTISTLDIGIPTYAVNPSGAVWAKSKKVTITYPKRQSNFIFEYSIDSAKTWIQVPSGQTQEYLFTANGNITARVRDGYNTVAASTLTVTMVDSIAPGVPTSSVKYDNSTGTVRGNSSAWTNRTLWWGNFSATDDSGGSGIDHYEYSSGCTGTLSGTLSSSYTYSTTRNSTFCIRAVDKAGNTSAWSSTYYFRIDKAAPGVPTSTIRYDSASGTVRGNTTAWTNRTLWWGSFSGTDTGGSGVARYEYSTGCSGSVSGTLSSSHTYASNTNYTFCIRTVDNAGNTSGWSSPFYIRVDKSAPGVPTSTIRYDNASGTVRGNTTAWTNRTLWWGSFSGTDTGGSGVNRYEYSTGCSGSVSGKLSSSHTYSSNTNYTFCIRTVDNAGNASGWSSPFYIRVDKTAPSCSTSGGRSSWSKSPLTLTGSCSDSLSGCKGNVSKYFSTTTSTASPGTVYDNAGNSTTCPAGGVYIDTTAPNAGSIGGKLKNPDTAVVSGTNYGGSWTNQYVQVSASGYSDSHSGVNRVEVIVTGASTNGTFNQTSRSIQASGTSNIKFRIWDNAGNYADTGTLTVKIDRRKPYTPKFNSISLTGAKKTSQSCTSSSATETSAITCTIKVTATAYTWGFTENVSFTDQPSGSGIKKQQYMWNHNGTNSNGYTGVKCTSWVDSCNPYSAGWKPSWIDFSIRAVDKVGNASSALKIAFKVTW